MNFGPDWLNDFADSLDPLHLDDALFGDGDGYTSFDEMMLAEDEDESYGGSGEASDCYDDCSDALEERETTDCAAPSHAAKSPSRDAGITLTFSVAKPPRTAPTEGMWKYYDEGADVWDFKGALLDAFPELIPDYEGNTHVSLAEIVTDTYEIDKPRAIEYLRWIRANFPRNLFSRMEEDASRQAAFLSRADVIQHLLWHNDHDEYLHELLKSDEFLEMAFVESSIPKHDLFFPRTYISYLLNFGDFPSAAKAYSLFLRTQKGLYGAVDLGKMWESMVMLAVMCCSELQDDDKRRLLEEIKPLAEEIGVRGVKVTKLIDGYLEELRRYG